MVSTFVGAAVVFSAVLTGDAVVVAVVSRIGVVTSVIAGNVLDCAIVSEFTSFVGLTVECALVLSSIPRGVAVTSAIFCVAVVAVAVVARAAVVSAIVTGDVDDSSAVGSDSGVVKCFGFISEVVSVVVDV